MSSVVPSPNPPEREGLETEIFQLVVRLHERADGQAEWLRDNAPFCAVDQKHLDENTPERAYWHYGYMVALRDVLGKLDHFLGYDLWVGAFWDAGKRRLYVLPLPCIGLVFDFAPPLAAAPKAPGHVAESQDTD